MSDHLWSAIFSVIVYSELMDEFEQSELEKEKDDSHNTFYYQNQYMTKKEKILSLKNYKSAYFLLSLL